MRDALLYTTNEDGSVRCFLCAHRCHIRLGEWGFCLVRKNIEGKLVTYAHGRLISEQVDPVEKKPLYHFLPATKTYSVATIGCNFRCGFCQNWQISQTEKGEIEGKWGRPATAEQIVEAAISQDCRSISFTYTEPTIFLEYALETSRIARDRGLKTVFVSNGYMTAEALELIAPYLDACNIDLKAFSDQYYRSLCKARLEPVLESLRNIVKAGIWLEITTLIVPGENDSEEELNQIASFISNELGRDVPWHISRFFPQYRLTDHPITPLSTVQRAQELGIQEGLRYVYMGNVPGASDTVCPVCGEVIIHREGYRASAPFLQKRACKTCGVLISGVWE